MIPPAQPTSRKSLCIGKCTFNFIYCECTCQFSEVKCVTFRPSETVQPLHLQVLALQHVRLACNTAGASSGHPRLRSCMSCCSERCKASPRATSTKIMAKKPAAGHLRASQPSRPAMTGKSTAFECLDATSGTPGGQLKWVI